jgi:hypothetical protein
MSKVNDPGMLLAELDAWVVRLGKAPDHHPSEEIRGLLEAIRPYLAEFADTRAVELAGWEWSFTSGTGELAGYMVYRTLEGGSFLGTELPVGTSAAMRDWAERHQPEEVAR